MPCQDVSSVSAEKKELSMFCQVLNLLEFGMFLSGFSVRSDNRQSAFARKLTCGSFRSP